MAQDAGGTDAIEAQLIRLWTDVLQVPAGPSDNFFSLGGHSLLAVNVVAAANDEGLNLKLTDLFGNDTLHEVALTIYRRQR